MQDGSAENCICLFWLARVNCRAKLPSAVQEMSLREILSCLPSVDTRCRFDADTMLAADPDGRVAGVILPLCRPHATGKIVGKWLRRAPLVCE